MRTKSVAEVNLDYECREAIEAELEHASGSIFDEAKFVVLDLIKYDLYVKFLESDVYRNFKGIAFKNNKRSTSKDKTRKKKKDLTGHFTDSLLSGLPSTNRFPVNRRRNVHLVDSPHLSFDQISSLSKCLRDPLALDEFLKFAYKEFSDSVVQFYLDVERYEVISPFIYLSFSLFDCFCFLVTN